MVCKQITISEPSTLKITSLTLSVPEIVRDPLRVKAGIVLEGTHRVGGEIVPATIVIDWGGQHETRHEVAGQGSSYEFLKRLDSAGTYTICATLKT